MRKIGQIFLAALALGMLAACAAQPEDGEKSLPDGTGQLQSDFCMPWPEAPGAEESLSDAEWRPVQEDSEQILPPPGKREEEIEESSVVQIYGTPWEEVQLQDAMEQEEWAARFTPEDLVIIDGEEMAWEAADNGSWAYLYTKDAQDGRINAYYCLPCYEQGNLIVYRGGTGYARPGREAVALVAENGRPEDLFFYTGGYYCMNWEEGEETSAVRESSVQWDPAARRLTEFYNRSDLTLITDFSARQVSGSYDIQPENMGDVITGSADGAWDICRAGRSGAGDYYAYNVVLRENATGRLQWLSYNGDDSSDYGFFRNGDLYVREPTTLRILTATSGYTQQAPFAMEFGSQPDRTIRVLHAIHRDPADGGYVVLYSQCSELERNLEGSLNAAERLNDGICYRIALCDAQGNLQSSWTSGQPRALGMYSFGWEDMTRDGDTMYVRSYGAKRQPWSYFSFSLTDHTFTALELPENG